MNCKTTYLKLSKETPKIMLTSDIGFEKIEMLNVIGNQINKLDEPLGIRWTLVCSQNKYDCFCWQLPIRLPRVRTFGKIWRWLIYFEKKQLNLLKLVIN